MAKVCPPVLQMGGVLEGLVPVVGQAQRNVVTADAVLQVRFVQLISVYETQGFARQNDYLDKQVVECAGSINPSREGFHE